jgi:hypothetical protein
MNINDAVEIDAVRIFLNFKNISYRDSNLRKSQQKDSVDVYFDKLNLEFQITTVEGDMLKLIRDKKYSTSTSADDVLNKFIIRPIENKIKKYRGGDAIKNTTLLIQTINIPPEEWLMPDSHDRELELKALYKKSGFKDIYLVVAIQSNIIDLFIRD